MNSEFRSDEADREQIVGQLEAHMKTLKTAWQEALQLQAAGLQQSFVVALRTLERRLLDFSWNTRTENAVGETAVLASYRTQNAGQLVVAASQLSQLDFAGKKASDRMRKLTAEIRRLSMELSAVVDRQSRSFESYSDIADIYGMQTKLEWKTVLRATSRPAPNNFGARYLRAVTLRRLGRFDEAEDEFKQLASIPLPFQPQIVAGRAENLQHLGRTTEASRLFGTLNTAKVTGNEVAGYRGIFEAVAEDWNGAQRAWEQALIRGDRELEIRRNLALVLAMQPMPSASAKKQALEHAELASEMSLKREWSVEAARAIALHLNEKLQDSQVAMDLTLQLCSGECLTYCQSIFDDLEAGQSFSWDFNEH